MNLHKLGMMRDALSHCDSLLSELISAESDDFDALLDRLTLTKRTIFDAFGEIAQDRFANTHFVKDAKLAVVAELSELLRGVIPQDNIAIPNFIRVHETLLAYMFGRIGKSIPGAALRAITGDQIHAERRVRQFRDIGFTIKWKRETGDFKYVMESKEQDLRAASLYWIEHKLKEPTVRGPLRASLEEVAASLSRGHRG